MLRHFRSSLIFTIVCFILAAVFGWTSAHSVAGVAEVVWIVLVLAILEVSLSFDNAVVNAAILRTMDPIWSKRFLTWGMLISVFGVRIVFPLAIVAIAAGIGPIQALELSLRHPDQYEVIVSAAHVSIAGFGGAFLLMVGLGFFFDQDKDVHWIGTLERFLSRFAAVEAVEIALVLIVLLVIGGLLPPEEAHRFVVAGMLGLISFVAMEGLGTMLKGPDAEEVPASAKATTTAAKAGVGAFLYLNLLDATFSFDGVIGAFALSNSMPVIALGLSIGAMFVRSLTTLMVERDTLAQYRYLEHGAFWAILALGVLMLVSARYEVPEVITGLIGALVIGLSLVWSVRYRRRNGVEAPTVH
ncbi:MAG: DUF475 domain-containing protein [Novosphingobium sp.]|nr:DUF475 domain-containing protein [Novosphingobium sp.]